MTSVAHARRRVRDGLLTRKRLEHAWRSARGLDEEAAARGDRPLQRAIPRRRGHDGDPPRVGGGQPSGDLDRPSALG
jgi:hypothetical protein